jgi:hypothetical protein
MKLSGRKGVLAACLAVLAACDGGPTGIVGERMELIAARRTWSARNLVDYTMTVRLTGAWFAGAAQIRVRNGEPVSVQPVDPGNGLTPEMFRGYDTVEELFGIVENAVAENAFRLDAEYHSRYGLPVDVYVDLLENAVDEEHGFIVESFRAE